MKPYDTSGFFYAGVLIELAKEARKVSDLKFGKDYREFGRVGMAVDVHPFQQKGQELVYALEMAAHWARKCDLWVGGEPLGNVLDKVLGGLQRLSEGEVK